MRVIVLDESKTQKDEIKDIFERKGHDVRAYFATADFIQAVDDSLPDKIIMNVDAWLHGKAIYSYFNFVKKLENIPIVFYNAPENFNGIQDRNQNQDDVIISKGEIVKEVIEEL